ncbi:MAG: hypothetical protein AAF531_02695, partial [Actinomycetota bacterium]
MPIFMAANLHPAKSGHTAHNFWGLQAQISPGLVDRVGRFFTMTAEPSRHPRDRWFEDWSAGDSFTSEETYVMAQDRMIEFAAEFDPQPFHTDPVAAADTSSGMEEAKRVRGASEETSETDEADDSSGKEGALDAWCVNLNEKARS